MVQNIISPKEDLFPRWNNCNQCLLWTATCTVSQETEGKVEAQHFAPEISSTSKKARLSFKHMVFFPILTALYFKDSELSSRNLYFTSGLLLTCWLILEELLPLYIFQFPNLKNEGNYTDLFSELPWEQLKGEAIYGLDVISKVRKPQNEPSVYPSCFQDLPSTS